MNADFPSPLRPSRIRSKINVQVGLVLADGTQISGAVFIGLDERVQDLLNDSKPFFPVRLASGEVLLVNKTMVAVCRPEDRSSSAAPHGSTAAPGASGAAPVAGGSTWPDPAG